MLMRWLELQQSSCTMRTRAHPRVDGIVSDNFVKVPRLSSFQFLIWKLLLCRLNCYIRIQFIAFTVCFLMPLSNFTPKHQWNISLLNTLVFIYEWGTSIITDRWVECKTFAFRSWNRGAPVGHRNMGAVEILLPSAKLLTQAKQIQMVSRRQQQAGHSNTNVNLIKKTNECSTEEGNEPYYSHDGLLGSRRQFCGSNDRRHPKAEEFTLTEVHI